MTKSFDIHSSFFFFFFNDTATTEIYTLSLHDALPIFFFKSANRDQRREWYSKHLGLADKGQGAMLPWREHDDPQKEHVTVWTVFPASTKYFDPSPAPFMINYIVDDMDALLDRLKQEGVKIDAKRMDESYGRFAWIYDLDGNKIELWQPLPAKP